MSEDTGKQSEDGSSPANLLQREDFPVPVSPKMRRVLKAYIAASAGESVSEMKSALKILELTSAYSETTRDCWSRAASSASLHLPGQLSIPPSH